MGNTFLPALRTGDGGEIKLLRSTISAQNDASVAIEFNIGAVRLSNSIVVGRCTQPSNTFDAGGNLESPGDTCNLGDSSRVSVSAAALALGPLADNGGSTLTRMPLAGSVAIGATTSAAGAEHFCTRADQRGYLRRGTPCDIGAVEAGGVDANLFYDGFEF